MQPASGATRAPGGAPAGQDAGSAGLHDASVGDARGAYRLAVAALEAEVQVGEGAGCGLDPLLGDRSYEVQPSARRFRLQARLRVGGAVLEAEAAVDAAGEVGVAWGEGALRRHHSLPTKRPGLSTPPGSNCALTRRISSIDAGGSPKTSRRRLRASGQRSRTSVPPAAGGRSRTPPALVSASGGG